MRPKTETPTIIERVTTGVGSLPSLVLHTLVFLAFFVAVWLGWLTLETMLLVLTTAVSLEAIYLAIFIQMTVNKNTASLREVEEDIEEIQEDVEEIGEDIEEIGEDIDEIQEDVEEMSEDIDELQEDVEEMSEEEKEEERGRQQFVREAQDKSDKELLEKLTVDVGRLLADLEALKKGK